MKKYKEIQEKRQTQVAIVCDWCGKKNKGDDWTTKGYDVNETIISHRTGSCYPECGMGETITTDLCPDCFGKLMELLKDLGVKIRKEEWDR